MIAAKFFADNMSKFSPADVRWDRRFREEVFGS